MTLAPLLNVTVLVANSTPIVGTLCFGSWPLIYLFEMLGHIRGYIVPVENVSFAYTGIANQDNYGAVRRRIRKRRELVLLQR